MNTEISRLAKLHNRIFAVAHLPNFQAQVISAYYKDYRNQAFVVTEQALGRHKTTIIASSGEAQQMGIFSGMAIHEIDGDLKHKIQFVPRSKTLEQNAHADVIRAVDCITPMVKRLSDNEYLLDITGTPTLRRCGIEGAGNELKTCLRNQPGFTNVAVGIAQSKICARVVARKAIPEGIIVCNSSANPEFLQAAVDLLPNLTTPEKEKLHKLGILRINQLRNLFGKNGERLFAASMGMDLDVAGEVVALIAEEEVLEVDVNDLEELFKIVLRVTDRVFDKIQQRKKLVKKLVLTIQYGDNQKTETQVDLPYPTNRIENPKLLRDRFVETYTRRVALRSISIRVVKSQPEHGQLLLFDSTSHKKQKRTQAIKDVRARFGFGAIENGNYFGVSKTGK